MLSFLRVSLETALRALGILLYWARLHHAVIHAGRRRVRVLCYHACEAQEHDWIAGLGSNTPPTRLEAHLDYLRQHYTVVSLDQLEGGDHPDRAALITFDDGYRSVYSFAFPLLRARGLPATVYLVTRAVDNQALVWVNELNWFLRRHGAVARAPATERLGLPSAASVNAIIDAARDRFDPELVASLLGELRRRVGCEAEALAADASLYLTWDQVLEMAAGGITFGSHTATHPNLARLGESAQREEMRAARDALRAHGLPCTSLAYPFGDCSSASRRLAVQEGYRSVMEVGGGNQRLDPLRIGRVSPRSATHAAFFAELEVVAAVVAWLKGLRARWVESPHAWDHEPRV
jgi:peptidoglycan/xylan/chitin deacetylase (PgdA/CDA1 family)